MDDIRGLIAKVNADATSAQDALFTAAYSELRQLARSRLLDGGKHLPGYDRPCNLTERTVRRDWDKARLLLTAMLRPKGLANMSCLDVGSASGK